MSTKWKIITGFIVMIVLIGTVAFIGYSGLTSSMEVFKQYGRLARINVNTSDILAHQYAASAAIRLFRINADPASAEEARKQIVDNRALAIDTKANSSRKETIDAMDEVIKRAEDQLQMITVVEKDLLRAMEQYEKVQQPAQRVFGKAMISLSNLFIASRNDPAAALCIVTLNDFAYVRSAISRFAYSRTEKDAARALETLAVLPKQMDALGKLVKSDAERESFAELEKALADVIKATKVMNGEVAELSKNSNQLMDINTLLGKGVSGVSKEADTRMVAADKSSMQINQDAQTKMFVATVSGLIAGVLLACFAILGLIKVLKELGVFAGAVASGDFSYQIKNREKGEIGSMIEHMKLIPEVLTKVMTQGRELANSIAIGKFRERFDVKEFKGGFADLTGCINSVGDAYTAVLDAMPTAIFSADGGCSLRFLNTSAQRVLGSNAVGRACGDLFKTPACNARECFGRNALHSDRVCSGDTHAMPGTDKIELAVNAVPLHNLAGKADGFMEIMTDVTEVREAQATMLQVAQEAMALADRVAAASEELSAQVEEVSRGAEMQRERVESTATAMNEMNSTVLEVARNAGHASEQSEETRKKAGAGAELVNKVVNSINGVNTVALGLQDNMKELGQQAESIGGVMNIISDIADQTNLLALNAAIEAARAGEAGRGFAVVADEVRKLAEKTMDATQEVGGNIHAIQHSARTNISEVSNAVQNIGEATELANASGQALHEIVDLASSNSSVVVSIAAAAEEQSATSEEINHSLEDVSRIVVETTSGMVQASNAVQDLAQTAQELKTVMERLH